MIGITGKRSGISEKFTDSMDEKDIVYGTVSSLPHNLDEYLLCAGVLIGKSAAEITEEEALETVRVNFIDVVRFCERVFSENDHARICVIGSESGVKGSYDSIYAGAKSALHLYVQSKKLIHPNQHLVCIAPTIIENTGMTQRRKDLAVTLERGELQKLGRWLQAEEVARVARFALNELSLCNSVIRMTGGI